LQTGIFVQPELPRDGLAVGKNFRAAHVFFGGNRAGFFQQRKIDIGLGVTGGTGIAVPVPGAAEIGALIDDTDVLHPGLAQPGTGQQPSEAATDNDDIHDIVDGIAHEVGITIGILEQFRHGVADLDVLIVAVRAQALVAFGTIFGTQRGRVEIDVKTGGGSVSVGHGAGLPDLDEGRRYRLMPQR
jgi:hypothetical protein